MTRDRHRVVALLLPGVVVLDFGAVTQFFGHRHRDAGPVHYDLAVCSPDGRRVPSAAGVDIGVDGGPELLADADTVVVPGYEDILSPLPEPAAAALRAASARGARLVSICTGAFALGHSGLLDGRRATTHWHVTGELRRLFPAATVVDNELYVVDDAVLTSGGVAAGIDLCLRIVREDCGVEVANAVARRSLVAPHRSGDQAQFVEHPVPEPSDVDIAALLAWIDDHLGDPLRLADLAGRTGYSVRTFGRLFRAEVGIPPWQWVTRQRILRARHLLEASDLPVEQVAARCGFTSTVAFRRRFHDLVHVSPSQYRRTFRGEPPDRSRG